MYVHSGWTDAKAVQRFRYPMAILTDNGPQFTSDSAVRCWQCLYWTTPVYHPRANIVERRKQELEGQTPERWDEKLEKPPTDTHPSRSRSVANYGERENRRTPSAISLNPNPNVPGKSSNELWYREMKYDQPNAPMPI